MFRSVAPILRVPDRRERLRSLIVCVSLLSLLDLSLTFVLMYTTGMYELNPLAVAIVRQGPIHLGAFKIACTLLTARCLWIARSTRTGEIGAWLCLFAMIALALHWNSTVHEVFSDGLLSTLRRAGSDPQWVHLGAA